MEKLIARIKKDIEINERCLQEKEISYYCQELLKKWLEYDKELLHLINEINIKY